MEPPDENCGPVELATWHVAKHWQQLDKAAKEAAKAATRARVEHRLHDSPATAQAVAAAEAVAAEAAEAVRAAEAAEASWLKSLEGLDPIEYFASFDEASTFLKRVTDPGNVGSPTVETYDISLCGRLAPALEYMDKVSPTIDDLKTTKVGKHLSHFAKHSCGPQQALATQLIRRWKETVATAAEPIRTKSIQERVSQPIPTHGVLARQEKTPGAPAARSTGYGATTFANVEWM